MSYKTIVVHLDCSKRRSERLDLAVALAQEFDAALVGHFAIDVMQTAMVPEDAPELYIAERRRREKCAEDAAYEFDSKTTERKLKAEWRSTASDAVGAVCSSARYADLVIVGQIDPATWEADGVPRGFAGEVVLDAGKPVLIVPYLGHFSQVGKKPLVAWNAAREAALAVFESLPVLQRADSVDVVSFERRRSEERQPDEFEREAMSRYLGRHGVKASIRKDFAPDVNVGDLILSRAADAGADAIVMGAYGHSRLRERVLGGATKTVLESMTVPVMMSH
jgi:nucleotide-binding universal stress UspA family protein